MRLRSKHPIAGRCQAVALASLLLLVALPAQGQARFRGLEGAVGYYGWSGTDFGALGGGLRAEGIAFLELHSSLGVGFGGSYGIVPVDGSEDNARELSAGVVVRQALGPRTGVHVFVEGFLGWSGIKLGLAAPVGDLRENGIALGPGMGLEIPFKDDFFLVLAADARWQRYLSASFTVNPIPGVGPGGPLESDPASGWRWGLRVGVHFDPTS